MTFNSSINFRELSPSVVASIGTNAAWDLTKTLIPGEVDFLEVRADLLLQHSDDLPGAIEVLPLPVILTVRSLAEGGKNSSNSVEREKIYHRYLPQVAGIDLELATAFEMFGVISSAKKSGCAVILSYHNFQNTPSASQLEKLLCEAVALDADILKIATVTDDLTQLATLANWLEAEKSLPIAVMGMGRFGKISRPLLAQLGSRLNYGYLDAPLVPGQWPAAELRRVINSLAE